MELQLASGLVEFCNVHRIVLSRVGQFRKRKVAKKIDGNLLRPKPDLLDRNYYAIRVPNFAGH